MNLLIKTINSDPNWREIVSENYTTYRQGGTILSQYEEFLMKNYKFFNGITGDWYIYTPSEESFKQYKILYINTKTVPVGDSTDPVEILERLLFDTYL